MSDFKLTVETTSIVRHNPAILDEVNFGNDDINLNALIERLLQDA